MLITLLKNNFQSENITLEDLIYRPSYFTYDTTKNIQKHYTLEISEDNARKIYNKLKNKIFPTLLESLKNPPFPKEEIPQHYYQWKMSKRSDPRKKRIIDAPDEVLKNYQKTWQIVLQEGFLVQAHNAAHGYVKNRSNATLMRTHQNANNFWNLELDFKDFFPSHTKEYLKKMLLQVFPFPFLEEEGLLDNLLDYACLEGKLPQGTPISPILTNIAMVPIDRKFQFSLTRKDPNKKFVYTRYSDNIYISCKTKFQPGPIINKLKEILKEFDSPLELHPDKIKYGSHAGRNYHLGIILNKDNHLSIGHKKNQKFRAMLFNFIRDNIQSENYWTVHEIQKFLGLISYYESIELNYIKSTIYRYNKKFHCDIIETAKALIKNF